MGLPRRSRRRHLPVSGSRAPPDIWRATPVAAGRCSIQGPPRFLALLGIEQLWPARRRNRHGSATCHPRPRRSRRPAPLAGRVRFLRPADRQDGQLLRLEHAGQLGDGTKRDRLVPTPFPASLASSRSWRRRAELRVDGAPPVELLGIQLGRARWETARGSFDPAPRRSPESPGARPLKVVVGATWLRPRRGRAVSCWGLTNTARWVTEPRSTGTRRPRFSGLPACHLVAGENHVCALLADRTVSCWGYNVHGELGDGSTINRGRPTPVPGLADVAQIALGVTHTCALLTSGAVLCWATSSPTSRTWCRATPTSGA